MAARYEAGDFIETFESLYRVLLRLGTGGMCSVYLVLDEAIGRKFVLKMLHASRARSRDDRHRFYREGAALAQLTNDHIVSCVRRSKTKKGEHFILLEHAEGQSVRELLDRDRVLPLSVALKIIIDLLDALIHAHGKDVVHRDIKPENVLFRWDRAMALLIDFGIMKALDERAANISNGASPCTRAYAAPEQLASPASVGRPTDIHAVGILLFEMITGEHPYQRDSIEEIMDAIRNAAPPRLSDYADVPIELDAVVAMALSKDPEARPDAAAFRGILLRIVEVRARERQAMQEKRGTAPRTTDGRLTDTRTMSEGVRITAESLRHTPDSVPGDRPVPSMSGDPDTLPLGVDVLRDMRKAHPEAARPWAPLAAAVRGSVDGVWRSVTSMRAASGGSKYSLFVAAGVVGLIVSVVVGRWTPNERGADQQVSATTAPPAPSVSETVPKPVAATAIPTTIASAVQKALDAGAPQPMATTPVVSRRKTPPPRIDGGKRDDLETSIGTDDLPHFGPDLIRSL